MVPDRARQLQALARTLHAVSPLPTLERGYAVVTDPNSGQPVTRATDTAEGRTLSTRFSDGRVISRVESVHPDPESRED